MTKGNYNLKFFVYLLFLVILFTATETWATDYYVSQDGSDSNDGTADHPWRTIQKAADTLVGGDTVTVSAGTYDERVVTQASGSHGDYIIFRVSEGEKVVMRGFDINHDYIFVRGFDITGPGVSSYHGYIDISDDSDFCLVSDNTIHDGENNKFGVRYRPGSTHCVVKNNVFDNVDWTYINICGSNHVVEGNILKNDPGWDAIRFFGQNHIIRNNWLSQINKTGENHTDLFQTFGVSGYDCHDIIVECNYAIDCSCQIGNFEENDRDIRDFTFRNNVFINITSSANMLVPNVRWYNNTFYNCATRNNNMVLLFANNSVKGVAHNGEVKNNLFIGCAGTNDYRDGWYRVEAGVQNFDADYNFVAQMNGMPKIGFNEIHGINGGDPKFINIAEGDFHLLSDSPAIGVGMIISGFNIDKDGRIRSSVWDMGACEFLPSKPVNSKLDY